MDDRCLQTRKENIFTKFVNYFRSIFGKRAKQEAYTRLEKIKNDDVKPNPFEEIKINKSENKELIEIQKNMKTMN